MEQQNNLRIQQVLRVNKRQLSYSKRRMVLHCLGNATTGGARQETTINQVQNSQDQKFDEEREMKISMESAYEAKDTKK